MRTPFCESKKKRVSLYQEITPNHLPFTSNVFDRFSKFFYTYYLYDSIYWLIIFISLF